MRFIIWAQKSTEMLMFSSVDFVTKLPALLVLFHLAYINIKAVSDVILSSFPPYKKI